MDEDGDRSHEPSSADAGGAMHIHKPKPVKALGEFLSEIGVIVVGILIALGLEQAIETLHWSHQVELQKQALKAEIQDNAVYFYERLAVHDCMAARLDAVAAALARPDPHWKAPAFTERNGQKLLVYPHPWRGWGSEAWQNALVSGVAGHMQPDDVLAYTPVYSDIRDMHDMGNREALAAQQLQDLDQDLVLTDVSRNRFASTLNELRFYLRGGARLAKESLANISAMKLMPPSAELKKTLAERRADLGDCVKAPALD